MARPDDPENGEPTYDEGEAFLGKRKRPRKAKRILEDATTPKSWAIKPFALMVSLAVGLLFLCGGVTCYFNGPQFTEDPEEVLAIQREIFHIDLSSDYRPAAGSRMSYWGQKTKMAIFCEGEQSLDRYLMIIEYAAKEITEAQLDDGFSSLMARSSSKVRNKEVRAENEKTIRITVEGKERFFNVSTTIDTEDDGTESRSRTVFGSVFSHSGYASIYLTVPESDYDESAAIRLIESIHR